MKPSCVECEAEYSLENRDAICPKRFHLRHRWSYGLTTKSVEVVITPKAPGAALFDLYREERIRQGWEEFKWTSLSAPQQLVWTRMAGRLNELDV